MKEILLNFFTFELLLILILNVITTTLSQLKYLFTVRDNKLQRNIVVAIDSVFYIYSLSLVMAKDTSIYGIIVLTLGKLIGLTLADFVESKTVKKIYSYNFYLSDVNIARNLEEMALKENISITTTVGISLLSETSDIKRYILNMHLSKEQVNSVLDFLKSQGVEDPTADCVETNKILGKIKKRID